MEECTSNQALIELPPIYYPRVEFTHTHTHTHTHTIRHQEIGCHDLRSAKTTNYRLRHTKIAYIDGEKLERVTDCIFFGSKITVDGD